MIIDNDIIFSIDNLNVDPSFNFLNSLFNSDWLREFLPTGAVLPKVLHFKQLSMKDTTDKPPTNYNVHMEFAKQIQNNQVPLN